MARRPALRKGRGNKEACEAGAKNVFRVRAVSVCRTRGESSCARSNFTRIVHDDDGETKAANRIQGFSELFRKFLNCTPSWTALSTVEARAN